MEILQVALVTLVLIVIVNRSESCKPYYECKIIHDCPRMIQLFKNRNASDLEFIRKSNCGYVGHEPMVCCPTRPCWTPDGREGDCMSIDDCPAITSLNQSYASTTSTNASEIVNYILKSRFQQERCLNTSIENGVCCPFPSRPTQPQLGWNQQACVASHLPPKHDSNCCGVERELGHRISRGAPTHQYTWLAILEYDDRGQAPCAGSLISGLYVLTAAHCVSHAKPVSVLLGVYDRRNPGRHCNDEGENCMSQKISINEIIPHPKYSYKYNTFPNDIALLQLSNRANFNEFVRPICLPSGPVRVGQDLKLISAGWGATESQHYSNIKMAVEMPFLKTNDCSKEWRRKFGTGHICTGNRHGEGPCEGDSGGPLMHQTEGRFEAVGVHSFGTALCGVLGRPHVFTNVTHYLGWIHESIKIRNSS